MEYARVGQEVARILRSHTLLVAARHHGYTVAIAASETFLQVWLTADPNAEWPPLATRVEGAGWWEPVGSPHEEMLANQMAADLVEQLERVLSALGQ